MNFFYFTTLTNIQSEYIADLYRTCQEHDSIVYENFCNDDDKDIDYFNAYVLAYDKDDVVGFLMYTSDNSLNEIRGIVHPSYRRQGIFTKMLNLLKSKHELNDIIFVGKDNYPGISQCAVSIGYTESYHDFLMEFNSELFTPSESADLEVEFDESDNTYYYYLDDEFVGSCSIYEEQDTINIFQVFVEPIYRNRGFGHQIISDVLWDLVNSGKNIRLQVSETNIPACKLYKSCGFLVKDSIIYYYAKDLCSNDILKNNK